MSDPWKDYSAWKGFTGQPNSIFYNQEGYWGGRMAGGGAGLAVAIVAAPFFAAYEIYIHFPNESILGVAGGAITTAAVLSDQVKWPKAAKIAAPIAAALVIAGNTYLLRPLISEGAIPDFIAQHIGESVSIACTAVAGVSAAFYGQKIVNVFRAVAQAISANRIKSALVATALLATSGFVTVLENWNSVTRQSFRTDNTVSAVVRACS